MERGADQKPISISSPDLMYFRLPPEVVRAGMLFGDAFQAK